MSRPNLMPIADAGGRTRNFPGRHRPRVPLSLAGAVRDAAEAIAALDTVSYVTIGEKHIDGAPTGTLALIAYVRRKGEVAAGERIPKSVRIRFANGRTRNIPTDVVELHSEPRTLGVRAGNVIKAADGDQGMCGLTFDHDGNFYAATNAHVVANLGRNTFPGEPGVINPATQLVHPLGKTIYCTDVRPGGVTGEDLAVIHVTALAVDSHFLVGESAPIAAFGGFGAMPGARFWYTINGVHTLLDSPQPVVNDTVQISVDGAVFLYTGFWALRVVQGAIAPGHSGSLVCSGSGDQIVACGMLFGGAPPNWAYVFPIDQVWTRILAHLPQA